MPGTSMKVRAVPVGIHLFYGWGEEDVDALGFEECAVGGEGSGVAGEVLVGAELGWVDEDGCYDDVALLFCRANEREVAFVQGSHGGHEAQGDWSCLQLRVLWRRPVCVSLIVWSICISA